MKDLNSPTIQILGYVVEILRELHPLIVRRIRAWFGEPPGAFCLLPVVRSTMHGI